MSRRDDYSAGYFAELAKQVSKGLGRDNARKQRILARSPGAFAGMDSAEYASMSSRELAARELKELGISVGQDDDPEKMLDMHHAGRQWARDRARGSASDSAEPDFLANYLKS